MTRDELPHDMPVVELELGNDRLWRLTKVLAAIAALCLAATSLVALVVVTIDRNDYRDRFDALSAEQSCRSRFALDTDAAGYEAIRTGLDLNANVFDVLVAIGADDKTRALAVLSGAGTNRQAYDEAKAALDAALARRAEGLTTCTTDQENTP